MPGGHEAADAEQADPERPTRGNVRVNGLAPGLVATKMTKITTDRPDRMAGALARIPQGRLGTPADMAGTALFLASPLASYVTGHTVVVDGGLTL